MVYRTPAAVSLTPEQLVHFGVSLGLTADQIKEAALNLLSASEGEKPSSTSGNILTITLDHARSKMDMIAAGNYDYVNDFLRDNDPVEGKIKGSGQVEVTLELVHFGRFISTKDAIKEIKKMGLELARVEHLFAVGEQHPNLQKEFPIVAPGSVWQGPSGYHYVACLWGGGGGRDLSLRWDGGDWRGHDRFLAVRKS